MSLLPGLKLIFDVFTAQVSDSLPPSLSQLSTPSLLTKAVWTVFVLRVLPVKFIKFTTVSRSLTKDL